MDSMKEEANRLASFNKNWPLQSPVQPPDLARAGFFYTGVADNVQCVFCDGVLKKWENGDIPILEHRNHFPYCEFIMGFDVGNNINDGGRPAQNHKHIEHVVPKHPAYTEEKARLDSFQNWPAGTDQSPREMALAGFFYTGFEDQVECFFCGGGLRHWEVGDNPWEAHVRWYPQCHFVKSAPDEHIQSTGCTGAVHSGISDDSLEDEISTLAIGGTTQYPRFENLDMRIRSFKDIRVTIVNPQQQAAAGYFYDSSTSTTKCFCCGTTLTPETSTGNLFAVHEKNSPRCQYIISLPRVCQDFGLILHNDITRDNIHRLLQKVTTFDLDAEPEVRPAGVNNHCKVCQSEPLGMIYLPCGHLICCVGCSTSHKLCPLCCCQIWAGVKVTFG